MEANYEVHIVGYQGADLTSVPSPFFTNHIKVSTQGFSHIATSERGDRGKALGDFNEARLWCEHKFRDPQKPGVHVKLEAVAQQVVIDWRDMDGGTADLQRTLPAQYSYDAYVSAWDVHLDGTFDVRLKEILHVDGYIVLDYVSTQGVHLSTLTMHFLHPHDCCLEYERIVGLVRRLGGFQGNVYFEHPLAFVVYGNTIPRPIVVRFG